MKNLLITILLALTIWSCGSRKTNKSEIKEEAQKEIGIKTETDLATEKESEIKKSAETVKENMADVKENTENLEPIDPSKPMVKTETKDGSATKTVWENAKVNNHSKTDNSKTTEKAKEETNSVKKERSKSKTISDLKAKEETKKSDLNKETVKTTGFPWWTLWLLILIPTYLAYRKYKKNLPF